MKSQNRVSKAPRLSCYQYLPSERIYLGEFNWQIIIPGESMTCGSRQGEDSCLLLGQRTLRKPPDRYLVDKTGFCLHSRCQMMLLWKCDVFFFLDSYITFFMGYKDSIKKFFLSFCFVSIQAVLLFSLSDLFCQEIYLLAKSIANYTNTYKKIKQDLYLT